MKRLLILAMTGAMATPGVALGQQKSVPDNPAAAGTSEDRAADLMIRRIYIETPVEVVLPSAVMTRLRQLGYRNLHDFDIERGLYEVEATSPAGSDVELEIDPISGAILDIDDNWF